MAILTEEQNAELLSWIADLDALNTASGNARSFLQKFLTAQSLDVLATKVTVAPDWWPDHGNTWNDHRQTIIDAAEAIEAYAP